MTRRNERHIQAWKLLRRKQSMPQDPGPSTEKTTANTPVSGTDPGGTRPAPATGKPASRQEVRSGDQNADPSHETSR